MTAGGFSRGDRCPLTKVETSCDRILIAGGAVEAGNKGRRFDRAFKEEAVRLLQTSGRRQRQIAGDLGISVSALGRWVTELHFPVRMRMQRRRLPAYAESVIWPVRNVISSAGLLRQRKSMRFRFIDAERAGLAMPIFRLCRLLQVSVSGFYAWRNRGPSQRQLDDMVLLAHVRAAFRRSRESYGAERVHHELAENGIEVGRHRVARLMRGNGLSPKRKQKFKKTTDGTTRPSHRTFSTRTFGLPTSAISGRHRAGCTWPSCSTSTPGASSAGPWALASTCRSGP